MTAQSLAKQISASEESAYLGGLLHDIAKPASPENTYGKEIYFSDVENQLYKEFPRVWHAFVASKYIVACCGEITHEISDAVTYHTTGSANMLPLTQCVYIADFIEPGRNTTVAKYVKKLAEQDFNSAFNSAIYAIALSNINKLKTRQLKVHTETLSCFFWYKERIESAIRENICKTLGLSEEAIF